MAYFYFPETRTLEEIAAEFGDKIVLVDERDIVEAVLEHRAGTEEVEVAEGV